MDGGADEVREMGDGALPFSVAGGERRLRSFFLAGEAGRLEALLKEGVADAPYAALVAHPHPKGGGTMHNKVVYHVAKVFEGLGWPVLRFNFRGVGLSEGEHGGWAEFADVRVALDWLRAEFGLPIVASGFSFGSAMGLRAVSERRLAGNEDVVAFAAMGLPVANGERRYPYPFLPECRFPKLFLSGDNDEYAPLEVLREVVGTAAEPKRFVTVAGADHFFGGKLDEMQNELRGWVKKL